MAGKEKIHGNDAKAMAGGKASENAKNTEGMTVKKSENFSDWYNEVVLKAELADYAPVAGFMIVRPRAYMVWQKIQDRFNAVIQAKGVLNAYFPLLIPESFFSKEAEHAEGFAPELAWVEGKEGSGERVAIRPTSETIMYDAYSKWIRSWRDLPLRLNQWCNILRWEVKQTKLFLRTREFLWQEGHCVYETEEECVKEALMFLEEYRELCGQLLAIPVITGEKTESEKFAGAKQTFTIEALMPDGKALQMGTSHNLGQNFARAFGISFLGKDKESHFAWQNSWGFTTRLIGATIMVHSDDKGLVLPPNVAFNKCVIVPIYFDTDKEKVLAAAKELEKKLASLNPVLDDREGYSPGWKFNEWELKGIPLRIEIGPKDMAKKQAVIVRRDTGKKEFVSVSAIAAEAEKALAEMQECLLKNAQRFLKENTCEASSHPELVKALEAKKMVLAPFCMSRDCEEKIKAETTASSRCVPFGQKPSGGKCVVCGKRAEKKAYFAKSY